MSSKHHHLRRWRNHEGGGNEHFVLNKKKEKVYLVNAMFLDGGTEAPCFILLYRQHHLSYRNLSYTVNVDGRDLNQPLDNGGQLLLGVSTGRHKVTISVRKSKSLNRALDTLDLKAGEMQFYEVAIKGKAGPKTRLWDMGTMKCPIAKIPTEKTTTTVVTNVVSPQPMMMMGQPMMMTSQPMMMGQPMMMAPPQTMPVYGAPMGGTPMMMMPPQTMMMGQPSSQPMMYGGVSQMGGGPSSPQFMRAYPAGGGPPVRDSGGVPSNMSYSTVPVPSGMNGGGGESAPSESTIPIPARPNIKRK